MKICVCDNDEQILQGLIKNISESYLSEAFSVKCVFSADDMLSSSDCFSYDAYFINIDDEGLAAAEIIRRNKENAIIIICADTEKYIYEAFKTEALYYLLKPIKYDELSDVFKRMVARYKKLNPTISIRRKNEILTINISEIIYIEGYNRHLTFYTEKEEISAVGRIQNLCDKLYIYNFLRIHQGYAVNMAHIKKFGASEVEMSNGTKVIISIRRRTDALKAYDSFLRQDK